MAQWKTALVGAGLLLGGCSFASQNLLPTLTGEEPSGKAKAQTASAATTPAQPAEAQGAPTTPVATQPASPPQLNTTNFQPVPLEPVESTGTAVGQKVESMRGELVKLEGAISDHNSRLQTLRSQTVGNAQQYQQLHRRHQREAAGRHHARQSHPGEAVERRADDPREDRRRRGRDELARDRGLERTPRSPRSF